MNKLPLVSIIVPVYNVEKYLPECMDSLINQTYSHLEIITVNDGSTDCGLAVLRHYAEGDSRIVVVSQTNEGLSAARNKGIQYAHGDYICFLDSDDWIDLRTCEDAVERAEKTGADVVLWNYMKEYSNRSEAVNCIKEDKYLGKSEIHQLWQRIVGPVGRQLSEPQYLDSLSTAWGKLYKRELITSHQLQFVSTKEIGTEDLLFNVQIFKYIRTAYLMTANYSHYRKSNAVSLTSVYKSDLFSKWRNLQTRIWEVIKDDASLTQAYYNRVAFSVIGLGLNECFSDAPFRVRKQRLSEYLTHPVYVKAYEQLSLTYFAIHWRLFFFCAKHGNYTFLLLLLECMNRIRNKSC